jgi:hypothetical protein
MKIASVLDEELELLFLAVFDGVGRHGSVEHFVNGHAFGHSD